MRPILFAAALSLVALSAAASPPVDDGDGAPVAAKGSGCPAITIVEAGTAADYNALGVSGETISSVSATVGQTIVVYMGYNDPAISGNVSPALAWNGNGLHAVGAGPIDCGDGVAGEIFYLHVVEGSATADVILQYNGVNKPQASACACIVVTGLNTALANDHHAADCNSSGDPASGSITTSQACTFVPGLAVTAGPSGDNAGTWLDGFTGTQRIGTTTGVPDNVNVTVSGSYKVLAATSTLAAAKSGTTSRAWQAAVASFKQ